MICHATGRKPTRQHPSRKFIYLHTPSGPLWFWDVPTCEAWIEEQSDSYKESLANHDPYDTPSLIAVSPRPAKEATNDR
jgi:hypothetical protein